jgi:hypothetical protein
MQKPCEAKPLDKRARAKKMLKLLSLTPMLNFAPILRGEG